MNAHQQHLDKCVRESVPTALDHVGMHELADKFRSMPAVNDPYRIENAGSMLGAILSELRDAGKGLPSIIDAASPEVVREAQKYQSGLLTARALVEAARQATKQALHGGVILN
jgi:hypothetical protein